MHEFSLMDSILKTVEDAASQAGATRVLEVDLLVGEMAQVMDEAMVFAFEALTPGTICEGAELHMEFVKPRSRCADCGCEFEHDAFHRKCPDCGSGNTTMVAGKELLIDKIEADVPDDEDEAGE